MKTLKQADSSREAELKQQLPADADEKSGRVPLRDEDVAELFGAGGAPMPAESAFKKKESRTKK